MSHYSIKNAAEVELFTSKLLTNFLQSYYKNMLKVEDLDFVYFHHSASLNIMAKYSVENPSLLPTKFHLRTKETGASATQEYPI